MAIEAVKVPTRSSVWSPEDAKAAYELLTGANGAEPSAAKYGEYDEEGKARSQGMALDRLILAQHGRRFGVSVWKDQNGNYIGALLPREPIKNQGKGKGRGK